MYFFHFVDPSYWICVCVWLEQDRPQNEDEEDPMGSAKLLWVRDYSRNCAFNCTLTHNHIDDWLRLSYWGQVHPLNERLSSTFVINIIIIVVVHFSTDHPSSHRASSSIFCDHDNESVSLPCPSPTAIQYVTSSTKSLRNCNCNLIVGVPTKGILQLHYFMPRELGLLHVGGSILIIIKRHALLFAHLIFDHESCRLHGRSGCRLVGFCCLFCTLTLLSCTTTITVGQRTQAARTVVLNVLWQLWGMHDTIRPMEVVVAGLRWLFRWDAVWLRLLALRYCCTRRWRRNAFHTEYSDSRQISVRGLIMWHGSL